MEANIYAHIPSKFYVYAVIFRKTILCGMITDFKEVLPSDGTSNFTLRNLPHRKEAIFMYYTDIDEYDLDGLPSILTPAMAADTLCVHINTIYNLLRSGKMTGFRLGAAWRIRKKDLLEFLRQGGSSTT